MVRKRGLGRRTAAPDGTNQSGPAVGVHGGHSSSRFSLHTPAHLCPCVGLPFTTRLPPAFGQTQGRVHDPSRRLAAWQVSPLQTSEFCIGFRDTVLFCVTRDRPYRFMVSSCRRVGTPWGSRGWLLVQIFLALRSHGPCPTRLPHCANV